MRSSEEVCRALKILFLAHQFFPESRAGVEVVTLGLAKALRARGHDARVLAAKRSLPESGIQPGEAEDYEFDGVPVRRLGRPVEGPSRPYRLNYENEEMALGARDYALRFQPNIVHAMHLQGLSASVLEVFEELNLPVVYTAADFWTVCPVVDLLRHDGKMCSGPDVSHCIRCVAGRNPDPRIKERANLPGAATAAAGLLARTPLSRKSGALRQVAEIAERPEHIREKMAAVDLVLAYTELARDLLSRNGVGVGETIVSHYGIDTGPSEEARKLRRTSGALRFGFLGTLAPHKGPDLLLRAFRSLPPDLDATLDVHGPVNGAYGEELRSLAASDTRIRLRGAFTREELADVLAEMDALVVPSRWYENAPGVMFEAFAAGVPVISTNLGGMSEFVRHGENGLLFELNDIKGLTEQMRRLIEETGLLQRLRDGIGPVKTESQYVDELESIYESLISQGTES